MRILKTFFNEVILLEPQVHGDHRGFFMESYNKRQLQQLGIDVEFVQDNHSFSAEAGTVRGLHYQLRPMDQTKLICVLTGAIYDVFVDLRKHSPTFGKWQGVILNDENKRQSLIPKGFAHGFCTLVPNTHVLYKVDQYYSPEHDRGILWNDPHLNIDWPVTNPILSDRDKQHPLFSEAELNFM